MQARHGGSSGKVSRHTGSASSRGITRNKASPTSRERDPAAEHRAPCASVTLRCVGALIHARLRELLQCFILVNKNLFMGLRATLSPELQSLLANGLSGVPPASRSPSYRLPPGQWLFLRVTVPGREALGSHPSGPACSELALSFGRCPGGPAVSCTGKSQYFFTQQMCIEHPLPVPGPYYGL